jgi:hypothetical protein
MTKNNILNKYYDNDRASKVIYGAILISAYLITQSHSDGSTALSLAFGTLFAAVAIVLAEVYSDIIGRTIKHKRKLTNHERHEIEKDSLAIVSVSIWPSVMFFLSHLGLFSVQFAFDISYLLLIGVLVIFSYIASRLSGRSKIKSLMWSLIISIIGICVILVKYNLGH